MQPATEDQVLHGASYHPEVHGTSGPLSVGWTANMMGREVVSSVNQSFNALGLPFNHEPNAGAMHGFTVFPKSIDRAKNVREDAGRAYYWPVSKRPNLDIYLSSFAERLIWNPKIEGSLPKASGVVFTTCNGTSTILANREVILSAGSLMSPLLLEKSGVGNSAYV